MSTPGPPAGYWTTEHATQLPEYEPPAHPHTGDHCFGCGEPVRGPLDGTTMRIDGALRLLHMRCARERMTR